MMRTGDLARSRYRRAALLAVAAVVLLAPSWGHGTSPRPLGEVVAAHCRAREETATLRARFVQTKVFTVLGEEERSAGVLYYRKPDRLRWEYLEPDRAWTVIDGARGWAVFPSTRQVQRFELGGSRTDAILSIVGFGACGPAFADSFDMTLGSGPGGAPVLSMAPRRPELAASFTRIELTLDPKDDLPRLVVLHEITGDTVRFEFQDVRRGVPLEGSLFQFTTPKGYTVGP
jgi:outer membrane lipoprotein carrier protein